MEEKTTQTGVAAESGETFTDYSVLYTDNETLTALLEATQSNGDTLIEIETELITTRQEVQTLQAQLVETYKLLAFIFLLLIIFGVYRVTSSLINTA